MARLPLPTLRSIVQRAMLALGLLTIGCGSENSAGTDAREPLVLSLADGAASGNNQRGMTGETLRDPLRVVVTRDGKPVAGVEVNWYTTYGSIVPNGPTDASGIASAVWAMPPYLFGSREARVTLPNGPTSGLRFTAVPSHPKLEILAGGAQTGVVGDRLDNDLSVRVTWESLPLSGRAVHWFGAEVESSGSTDANGVVRGRWRLGHVAGQQITRLQLSPHAFDGPQAAFGATAKPGPPVALTLTSAQDSSRTWLRRRGGVVPVSAQVRDRYGNAIPQAEVAWVLVSSDGAMGAPVVLLTDEAGRSLGNIPIDSVVAQDDFSIDASLSGVPSIRRAFTVVDALMIDNDWERYLDPQHLTVPVGTIVSWANWSFSEHLLSVVTPLSDTTMAIGETIGSLWLDPRRVLTQQFHTPGTYVVACIEPDHWWERMTIQVTP